MGFWRKAAELFNLKTDRKIRDGITDMSDEQLLAKKRATTRSVTSSVTGLSINIALSVIMPAYAAASVVNLWQMGVSAINKHRVRREIKQRRKNKPGFARLERNNSHQFKDIGIGFGVKAALSAVTLGIIGGGEVINDFHEFAVHHAAGHLAGSLVGSAVTQHVVENTTSAAVSHLPAATHTVPTDSGVSGPIKQWIQLAEFKAGHPHLTGVDGKIHNLTSGIGDGFAKLLDVDPNITGLNLEHQLQHGMSKEDLMDSVVPIELVGAVSELTQPLQQGAELGLDKYLENKHLQKVNESVQRSTALGGLGYANQTQSSAETQKLLNVHHEMAAKLRLRNRSGE